MIAPNQSPLNEAAISRLRQLDMAVTEGESALLALAIVGTATPDGEPTAGSIWLSGFNRYPEAAMNRWLESETELTPEDVMSLPLNELAEAVCDALTPASPRD